MNTWTCLGALSGKNSKRITPRSVVITASRLAASSRETGGGSAPGRGAFFLRGGWAKPTALASRNRQRDRATERQRDGGTGRRGDGAQEFALLLSISLSFRLSVSPSLRLSVAPSPRPPVLPSFRFSFIILSPRFRWRESRRAIC